VDSARGVRLHLFRFVFQRALLCSDTTSYFRVKIYLATARPENNQYFLLGPGAGEAYNSALNGKNGDFLDKRNDCSIVESKTFEVPGVDQPVDPLSREVTVGEYNTLFDTVSSVIKPSDYRSAMRDIMVYDEAKDNFVRIGLRAALAHCCRFNERGLLHWPSDDWPMDPDHRDDMFVHKLADGTYRACTLFGDMSPEALTSEGLRLMGESVKAKVFASTVWADKDKEAFDAGMALIKTWASITPDPSNTGLGSSMPIGRLTRQGLKIWAGSVTTGDQGKIGLFLAAVEKLFYAVRELFPRSRALDASAASSWISSPESIDTFFENCIFHSGAPIWRTGGTSGSGSVQPKNGIGASVAQDEFTAVIMSTPGLSDDMKKALKASVAKMFDPSVVTPEQNLDAAKDLIMGALSSPLQELNSGNSETAAKVVREMNTAFGDLNTADVQTSFNILIRLIYNMYRYRNDSALTALSSDDEKHFNAMYAMHRLLTKVSGNSSVPVITSLGVVAAIFTPPATPPTGAPIIKTLAANIIAKPDDVEIVSFVDDIFNTANKVPANFITVSGGSGIASAKDSRGVTYFRTPLTSLVPADPSFGIVAVHPAKPEFTEPVLRAANALNGAMPKDHVHAHPGGAAALFGAFGGGHHGGHHGGGGFGHHAMHEGRHPPPFASKHHEHYHDEEEHDGGDRPPQRRRAGFFGAPGGDAGATFGAPSSSEMYLTRDGTRRRFDEVGAMPTSSAPGYGYEGRPPPRAPYGRRMVPIDEQGRMLTGEEEQARLGRRHREMAAERSLDGDMSDNFYDRYDGVLGDSDPITRAVKLAFLACPIYRGLLDGLIEKDVVFPFAFLLFRPFITHNMATAILTKKGAETGETLIGHADFQLGDDIARKMHYGHYTMYLKSIVYRQDNVFLAQNVYCQNYVNGNDTTFMGWHNLVNDNAPKGSIYSILQPFGAPETPSGEPFVPCSELPNPLDISGRHNTSAPHLVQLDDANGTNGRVHYANCSYYRHLWRWANNAVDVPDPQGWVYGRVNQYNTLCFQGHQGVFNPATSNYDNIQINTGHFGHRVYPGCGLVRRGMQKTLENVSYSSPHGIQRHITGVAY